MTTKQIILSSRPKGKPVLENFQTNSVELPEIGMLNILFNLFMTPCYVIRYMKSVATNG